MEDVSTTADGLAEVLNASLKSVPGINFRENIRNFCWHPGFTLTGDFLIAESKTAKTSSTLAGIKLPGLSAAPGPLPKWQWTSWGIWAFRHRERRVCGQPGKDPTSKIAPGREKAAVIAKDARYGTR